jgi:transitional endoplasmic reticulum ATPase
MPDAVSARVMKGEGPCAKPYSICLSKPVAEALGLKLADPVQVTGTKTTVAIIESIEDMKDFVLYLGRTVRTNADAHWDETVQLSRLEKKEPAKKVIIGPAEEGQVLEADVDALRGLLTGFYVNAGDLVEVGRRTFRPVFRDNNPQRFTRVIVVENKPAGIVQIVQETELVVNREFGQADIKTTSSTTYDDIGGMKEVIEKIREQIEIPIRNPTLFKKLGIDPPKGVLLHGPPGCGKTLLAKAAANESGAYFIGTGASQLAAGHGETERRLREIFAEAEQHQPSIIFIDEMDSIAPKREDSVSPDDRRIVGVILELMDGLKSRGQVIVMAATNRPNAIDPALRRPGRFDREIEIPIPNENGRIEILKIHSRYMPLEEDVDLTKLAETTHGCSGADLRQLCSEAAFICIRRHSGQFRPDGTIPETVSDQMKFQMADFLEGLKQITPSCGREVIAEIPKVKWSQIGGYRDLKRRIEELVLITWSRRQEARKYGIKVPKGILLYGPPGTGKTLLAKGAASETKVKVILIRGAKLKSKWFGEYEQNISKTFEVARKTAPVVLIVDEVESIASTRGGGMGEAGKALDSGLNEILQQLDGVEEIHDVFLICTTNRPDMIDSAFLRSGRIEHQFHVPPPDYEARLEIFKIHLTDVKIPLAEDVNAERLAELTDGMVGADIERIVRSASLKSFCEYARNDCDPEPSLQMRDFLTAIDEVRAGLSFKE